MDDCLATRPATSVPQIGMSWVLLSQTRDAADSYCVSGATGADISDWRMVRGRFLTKIGPPLWDSSGLSAHHTNRCTSGLALPFHFTSCWFVCMYVCMDVWMSGWPRGGGGWRGRRVTKLTVSPPMPHPLQDCAPESNPTLASRWGHHRALPGTDQGAEGAGTVEGGSPPPPPPQRRGHSGVVPSGPPRLRGL